MDVPAKKIGVFCSLGVDGSDSCCATVCVAQLIRQEMKGCVSEGGTAVGFREAENFRGNGGMFWGREREIRCVKFFLDGENRIFSHPR